MKILAAVECLQKALFTTAYKLSSASSLEGQRRDFCPRGRGVRLSTWSRIVTITVTPQCKCRRHACHSCSLVFCGNSYTEAHTSLPRLHARRFSNTLLLTAGALKSKYNVNLQCRIFQCYVACMYIDCWFLGRQPNMEQTQKGYKLQRLSYKYDKTSAF